MHEIVLAEQTLRERTEQVMRGRMPRGAQRMHELCGRPLRRRQQPLDDVATLEQRQRQQADERQHRRQDQLA
jgi:hypothetical protein